jgi:tRNA-specific 2-thiouridylase
MQLVVDVIEPLFGVSPGQTAVVYVGTRVLGQCTIDRTVSADTVNAAPVSADSVSAAPVLTQGRS